MEHRSPHPLLIKQLLHTTLARGADQEIVYRGELRYRYSDLRERVERLAGGLAALGVRRGDVVAVMDWDSHRYLECYFAVPMMGAVLQTVNIRLSAEQILYCLNHAEAKVVVVHEDFLPVMRALQPKLETVKKLVLIAEDGSASEYEKLLAESGAGFEFPDFDENAPATTFYTTGTTGLPKGVYFSHRQLVLHTLAFLGCLAAQGPRQSFHRDDVYMPITPMFHVHAWGIPYIATVLGVKQIYPGRYAPELLLDLIAREGVTFSHCVPTILHMLLSCPKAKEVDLRGWKVIIGGSALPHGLAKAALERGIDVFTGYGMSETCPVLTLGQIKPSLQSAGPGEQLALRMKAGLPVPLVDLRIVDAEMNDLPHDGKAVGEVVARAPWLTQGYAKDEQASERLWAGGFLHTQDVGSIDRNGYLQITDRVKDVIKSGGEWVSSLEIETLISQHPAVSEVAVIGVKDEKWGERPLALVVLKPGEAASAEEIVRHAETFHAAGRIPPYAVPRRVVLVEQIAKTSVGKIDKKLLRQQYDDAPR